MLGTQRRDLLRAAEVEVVVLLLRGARVVQDVEVDDGVDLFAPKDVLGASSADVHHLDVDVLGHVLHGAAIEPHEIHVAMQPTRHGAPEVARDPGDEDALHLLLAPASGLLLPLLFLLSCCRGHGARVPQMKMPSLFFNPSSITSQREESSMIGTREISGSEAMRRRNRLIAALESRSPSSILMSMI